MSLSRILRAATFSALILPGILPAEEGGSGHCAPGSMSSFMDGVPPEETFITRFNCLHYEGDFERGQQIPIDGFRALGVNPNSTAVGLAISKAAPPRLGTVLFYVIKVARQDLLAEVKWLHEFDTKKRPQGDSISTKMLMKF